MSKRVAAAALAIAVSGAAWAQEVPPHPKEIKYPELKYEPPKAADHRVVLANGLRVFLVPDRTVPTLHVEAYIDAGEVHVPKEKLGLAKLAGELLRTGGVEGVDARALDARLDAIAAEIDASFTRDTGRASLWTLSKHADAALALFALCLTKPVFAEDRIRRAKDDLKVEIAHRDDEPDDQLDRKVAALLYRDHPYGRSESAATVDAVGRDDLVAFHKRFVVPGTTILAVAGDFERAAMVKKLEALFAGWTGERPAIELVAVDRAPRPGVFLLDREVNQGFVEMAALGPTIGHKDEVPLQVMNFILGGGSFTSRITSRVRNDEGLAYSAGSYVRPARRVPGLIGVFFQSKAESTAFAAKICAEEVRRIREKPVSAEELDRAKSSLRDRFPERFSTAHGAASALAESELGGRPADWFETYRAKVAAVTVDEVQRVPHDHLVPERLSGVVIGQTAIVGARDEAHAAALEDLGKVEALAAD